MKNIKYSNIVAIFLTIAFLFTSCDAVQNANNQQKGTAAGAAAGAVLGGIIGNQFHHNGALGAILGGVIGGAGGNIIGNKMDKQAKAIQETLPGAQVERVGEGIKVTLGENTVNFDFNSSTLTSTAKTNLDKLATVLTTNPDTNINVYGYTDNKGTVDYNLKLSQRRAASVVSYLTAKGVASSRLTPQGMGVENPIASNDTDAGRAQNRRVEFAITANQTMINNAKQGQ